MFFCFIFTGQGGDCHSRGKCGSQLSVKMEDSFKQQFHRETLLVYKDQSTLAGSGIQEYSSKHLPVFLIPP